MNIKCFSNNPIGENCYAAETDDGIILVDPGFFVSSMRDYLEKNGYKVKYVLLTHSHFDHINAVNDVLKLCGNAKVVIHSDDEKGLSDGMLSFADRFRVKLNAVKADIVIKGEESVIPMGNTEIKVLQTSGHTMGSVCYIIGDSMFSGDTLFKDSYGRTDLVNSSESEMKKSLKKLASLDKNYTVYPGHGSETSIDYEKNNNIGMI